MAQMKKKNASPSLLYDLKLPFLGLGALALLLLVAGVSADSAKYTAIFMLVLTGLAVISKGIKQELTDLCTPMTLAVLFYMVVFGVTSFMAVAGKFALSEYSKLLVAFGGYALVLFLSNGKKVNKQKLIKGICFAMSVVGIVISTASISVTLGYGIGMFLLPITQVFMTPGGVETGIRMTSIFGNPNCFAGFMGLSIMANLLLSMESQEQKEHRVSLFMLVFQCIGFLLAFSMGASAAIAAGFVLMLLVMPKSKRGYLFTTMLLTLVLTLVGVSIAFPFLEQFDGNLSLVATVVCALVAGLLGERVITAVLAWCEGRGKLVVGVIVGLIALLVVGVILALTMTGAYTLDAGESLRRSAYPESGTYTLSVASDTDDLWVVIESQDERETIIHSSTVLYSGSAYDATFEVPEGSLVTYFQFSSKSGGTIQTAHWSGDKGSGDIALNYKLLPNFIANRLQGLFANENAIQRVAFFEDGLKLFALDPLTGRGLGGFENGISSVQSFYYETKYAHNHLIQSLCDAGILGGLAFVALLGTAAYLLIQGRRREDTAVTSSVLLGAFLFMLVHSMVELVFSHEYYLVFAFLYFAIINLSIKQKEPEEMLATAKAKGKSQPVKKNPGDLAVVGVSLAICLVFGGFWSASVSVEDHKANAGETVYDALSRFALVDYFNRNDAKLSYLAAVVNDSEASSAVLEQADAYADELAQVESNSTVSGLVQYYMYRGEVAEAFEVSLRGISYVKSSPTAWNTLFSQIASSTTVKGYIADPDALHQGLDALTDYFALVQSQQLDTLTLDDSVLSYLSKMDTLAAMENPSETDVVDVLFFSDLIAQ